MKDMLKPCKGCKTPMKCQREGECALEDDMEDEQMPGAKGEKEDESGEQDAISIEIKVGAGFLAKAMGLKK